MTLTKIFKRNDTAQRQGKAEQSRARSAARAASFRSWQDNMGLPSPMAGASGPQHWS